MPERSGNPGSCWSSKGPERNRSETRSDDGDLARMIINADDFGYSQSVNRAIVQSFDEGLISSTTLMANMPGFEEACTLAHEKGLLAHVGTHLVLSEGQPLTERVKRCRRLSDASGSLARSGGRAFWLTRSERDAVTEEFGAQIQRCRSEGLPVTHLDSHHHVHNEPAIGRIVIQLALAFGVPYVRVARNCGPGIDLPRRGYKAYLNRRLVHAGLSRTRYFGVVDDYLYMKRRPADFADLADVELMTHPVFDERDRLVEGLAPEVTMQDLVAQLDLDEPPVSYAGARYS
jgi:chitin disaccharide deacetylase